MYGSSSALPLTLTGPPFLHSTVSPPTAMTRLIRSFSSADGIRPMKLRNFCTDVRLGGGLALQPAARVVEDDDLAALGLGAEPRGELVDQHPVAPLQGVLHRVRGDRERLHQEGLDQQREKQRDADQERQLLPEGALLLLSRTTALGRRPQPSSACRRPCSRRPRRRVAESSVTAAGDSASFPGLSSGSSCPDRAPTATSPTSTPHSVRPPAPKPGQAHHSHNEREFRRGREQDHSVQILRGHPIRRRRAPLSPRRARRARRRTSPAPPACASGRTARR